LQYFTVESILLFYTGIAASISNFASEIHMATARHIIALLSSHNQRDEEQFLSIALQVAAGEARQGRKDIADELKRLVDTARKSKISTTEQLLRADSAVAIPISRPRGDLKDLLTTSYPKTRFNDVVLADSIRSRLDRVANQQRNRERLREYSQRPSSKILLYGSPGTGKTLTASACAGELHLPLFSIRLDSIITRFMGETSAKLRLVFDQIASVRGVYLFDEFDAIGSSRTAENDVGEMRRVLNSFLQFLEENNSTDSLIIASTNHPEILDKALFRRFDDILEYLPPDRAAVEAIIDTRLGAFRPTRISWTKIFTSCIGLSQADLVRAVDEVIKEAILTSSKRITSDGLLQALNERQEIKSKIFS
jgi:SpoVK/Ycf46/Vps4 family AAA+-type ATPase